ncbi:hypothetical protein B5E58_06790 [Tyzzerella sp. An114]|uniref:hypothetical protein n=1 Tax=Tyzzerella sp. An114 TaxID=1965545 RepID=UPI000B448703|nr:hypothetical protein [Tyzzerella sp. An114]OUQ58881.1 hypothetical protein B5E58_06790 [Tyzzerella sp. An114]HIT72883.1 hypothetical protein [Candidatus Fimicola cottocaccae]
MLKDSDFVQNFISSQKNLMQYFGCDGDFYVRPLVESSWTVKNDDDFAILSYWDKNDKRIDAVVVKKGGKPMVYKKNDFTMIIGIDCVKLAFIFKTELER